MNELKTKRDVQRAHRLLEQGKSLREVGDLYGTSHETIRQLFKRYGLSTNGGTREDRRHEREQAAWERREEIFASYRDHGSIKRVAKDVDLPIPLVRFVLAKMPLRNAYLRRGVRSHIDREQIKGALRTAWDLSDQERLTTTAYNRLAPVHGFPALQTVRHAFNSFYDACKAAGVPANPPLRTRSYFDRAYCLDSILLCARALRHAPSYEDYHQWQRGNQGYPAPSTIREIVGPWSEAVIEALGDWDA